MKIQKYIAYALWALIFLGIYTYGILTLFEKQSSVTEVHESGNYTFISPLLECNANYEYYNPGEIKNDIEKYIWEHTASWDIDEAAYYVRLLQNGSTFWYNQDTKFIPASLVKLPFAISLMRQISFQELNTQIEITELPDDTYSGDESPDVIEYGKSYTLYKLLAEMLINSDNTASVNILHYLNEVKWAQTYDKFWLGIVDFATEKSLNMSVKDYASFFRILYNASYLSRQDSEELLYLLSQSTFDSGIRKHLPDNILIANKFWTRGLETGEAHIHDCGIVYAETPYLICVMTKGHNRTTQLQVIQDISKMVYDDIVNQ